MSRSSAARIYLPAIAALTLLSGAAERTSNSFFTIEGEGVRIASDGGVCVDAGASGPVTLTARSGWLVNGRESIVYLSPKGLSSGLILTSKLGEDHSCSPPPPTKEDKHDTTFVLEAAANPANLIKMYALPNTSVVVTASAESSLVEKGKHKVTTTWQEWTCPVCGAHQEGRTEVRYYDVEPDTYEWTAEAVGVTQASSTWTGTMSKGLDQQIEFTVMGKRNSCQECEATATATATADVHELSVERPDYLGLDRTDAGLSNWAVTNATARIDPAPTSATYNWTRCGKCQFVGATNEQTVTYGITNSAIASTKFLAEDLKVAATASNADGLSASAICTTNFTVVTVDVQIGSVGENKEEKEGAFVQYVKDATGSAWTEEGTNALVAVTITCEPELPADEKVTITAPVKSLHLFYNGKYSAFPEEYSFTARFLKDVEFFLHGHDESATLTNRMITIAHDNSAARDKAKYANGDIRVTNIKFNHDHSASAEDAINIRRSYKEPIDVTNGEWIDTGSSVTNEPFCYTTNHSVTIKARLEASGFITSAVVRASCSGAKGSLSDVLETNVVFVGGVSSPEYVTFALKDKTLSKIDCSRGGVLKWSVSKVNDTAGSSCKMNETGPHTVYTIFSEPKPPWNNTYGNRNQQNAWTNALEFAIVKAGAQGASDNKAALSAITQYLHGGHGMRYDTILGAAHFLDGDSGGMMKLSNYILDVLVRKENSVNCYDQAGAVVAIGTLCGIEVEYVYMKPFGYINEVDLVGIGKCNNPFFEDPGYKPHTNAIEGADCIRRSSFGNHAFAMIRGDVFDACAGPVCGEALGQYTNMVIDVSTIDEASAAIGGRVYHKGDKFPIRQPPCERLVIGVTDLN